MKMTEVQMVDAVERSIGQLSKVYRARADESDLYEATLLAIAVEAAEAVAGTKSLITMDGRTTAHELVFRRGPGSLCNGSYTYAQQSFPNSPKELEIHLGAYVTGRSGVVHECDVAVLGHMEAERCREVGRHPRRSNLVASIEAKHYMVAPGINVGRSFVGLGSELVRHKCALAFPARGYGTSIVSLLDRQHGQCFDELIYGAPAASRLRIHLEDKIRGWLDRRPTHAA